MIRARPVVFALQAQNLGLRIQPLLGKTNCDRGTFGIDYRAHIGRSDVSQFPDCIDYLSDESISTLIQEPSIM